MRRRHLLTALPAAWVLRFSPTHAQERVHRIGYLGNVGAPRPWLEEGLRLRGWSVGRNLAIDYRFHEGRTEAIPGLAAELIALRPELIATATALPTLAVHAAAPEIPLVFVSLLDPVELRLVDSLAHPGGTATGLAGLVPEGFAGKSLQLLKEIVPAASTIAVLVNPTNPLIQRFAAGFPAIEQQLGVKLIVVEARTADQFDTAFNAAQQGGAAAINIFGDSLTFAHSATLVALAQRYRMPAIYFFRESAFDGGLLSFGTDQAELWRRAGAYIDKVLKGAKPADLPVEQPTKYEIVVNRKTAAGLGLTIPPTILAQADEVIE